MDKIIHKLDKATRYEIAINYVNDTFSVDLEDCSNLANKIAKELIHNFHSGSESLNFENFNSLCSLIDEMNYSTSFFNNRYKEGEVILNVENGSQRSRGIPFRVYELNNFRYLSNQDLSFSFLSNVNISDSKVVYSNLIHNNASDDLYLLESKYKDLSQKTILAFNACYELLKKVRTSELLMKHWSKAYKYLPSDILVDEPQSLTISEKFKLL